MSGAMLSAGSVDDFLEFPAIPKDGREETPDIEDADIILMKQIAQGDDAAFETLVKKYQKSLLNFFLRMGAKSECEDLVQNTFIRLYRYRERYQPTAKFTTFLYLLAHRVWADLGRKNQRRERLSLHLQNDAATAMEEHERERVASVDVEAALDRLSDKLRDVIVLHYYQGLPYQQIADVLQIPLGTVKSRINLAIQALRQAFHETNDTSDKQRV
jgi:RNA polymerase sigma-70 factor, ECF subfamily